MNYKIFTLTVIVSMAGFAAQLCAGQNDPRMPFAFAENKGQFSAAVRFAGTGPDFQAWFEDGGIVLHRGDTIERVLFEGRAMVGKAAAAPVIVPDGPLSATANFLFGNSPERWHTAIPLYSSLHYRGVWEGVDITYKAQNQRLKAEYLVSSNAGVGRIRLRFEGSTQIHEDGTLWIHTQSGDIVEDKPVLYQRVGGVEREVAGGFRIHSDGSVGYWAGEYDHSAPLVIDPTILFSGYFGGTSEDSITAIATDSLNNIVVTGWTASKDLPASAGFRQHYAGAVDAFVAAFLPNGGGLIYCTYLGGSEADQAMGLTIDSARNVYVTGWTSSTNFPVLNPVQAHLSGTRDAFVAKLNPTGSALIYSTYLGGSGVDAGYAIALSTGNAAVVVGDTMSTNFPTAGSPFQPKANGLQDAFVAMLAPTGNSLVFSTYLGGKGIDHASAVKIGTAGYIFIGGYTWSSNFPVSNAYQPKPGGGQDGFLLKMRTDGSGLSWSTFLGGNGGSTGAPEEVTSLCLDAAANVLVGGVTSSTNFPTTTGALQTAAGGQTDGFVTKFSNHGQLLQSTLVGGALTDQINALAVDFYGDIYVTGSTSSLDFPVQRPLQNVNAGSIDAFVIKLNSSLSSVVFGTYLGGSGSDGGNAIAVDAQTSIIVAGQTSSGDFPTSGLLANSMPSMMTSFLTKIAPSFTFGVGYANQSQKAFTADPWHVASYTASALYGSSTDTPIAGDWTATGQKRIGIFRNGTWILDTNGNGIIDAADKTVVFGQAGDVPVVGDWRGIGQIALGLFRNGTFILDLSGHLSGTPTGLQDATFVFGQGGDVPVAGDWNNSGTTKVGVFRNGLWLLDSNGDRAYTAADRSYTYGQAGDIPVVGDWDTSGVPNKIGVYRAGLWILDYDGDGVLTTPGLTEMAVGFGFAGYTPLVF